MAGGDSEGFGLTVELMPLTLQFPEDSLKPAPGLQQQPLVAASPWPCSFCRFDVSSLVPTSLP